MRPPICFVCSDDAEPDGALVHFILSERGRTWEQRTDHSGRTITGHHPDTGWFCARHKAPALMLASTHTIDEALLALR